MIELLREFEAQLDPSEPSAGAIPATVIGYGEMSVVMKIGGRDDVVCKRSAGFRSDTQLESTRRVVGEYVALLGKRGLDVVDTQTFGISTRRNGRVMYLVQPALPPESIGNRVLRSGEEREVRALLRGVLDASGAVWAANREPEAMLGLDAQLSNWGWQRGPDGSRRLRYLDVGSPFYRLDGREQLDCEVLLQALPRPVAWFVRRFVVQDLLDRFHDLGAVVLDMAGNFIKEGCADRLPWLIEEVARWRAETGALPRAPQLTLEAVDHFYDGDERIWKLLLAIKKLDRAIQRHWLRRTYPHVLPGRIQRRGPGARTPAAAD